MVFKPGPDPNRNMTGSRSKKDQEFFEKLRAFEPQSLAVIKSRLDRNDFEAAKWVNEMLYGKPKQQMEHSGANGEPIKLQWI
jgi:hypothetical protein